MNFAPSVLCRFNACLEAYLSCAAISAVAGYQKQLCFPSCRHCLVRIGRHGETFQDLFDLIDHFQTAYSEPTSEIVNAVEDTDLPWFFCT